MYFVRKGAFPKTVDALATERIIDRVRPDPWGNPYVLTVEADEPVVISYGPDGAAGGGDDISSKDSDA
jgi:general secretion pathway protein G